MAPIQMTTTLSVDLTFIIDPVISIWFWIDTVWVLKTNNIAIYLEKYLNYQVILEIHCKQKMY